MTDPAAGAAREAHGGVAAAVFPGAGEMAARCRALDWAATPLGPVARWPAALRAVAGLVLAAPAGMVVLWGPELVQLYNDAYRAVMGAKHPAGLGQPTRACWPEVWAFNAPLYAGVVDRGEAFTFEDQRLVIGRHGRPEEAFFTLTYSPVPSGDVPNGAASGEPPSGEPPGRGAVGGVLVTVFETTAQVRARDARELERERLLVESEAERWEAERRAAELAAVIASMPDAVYIGSAAGITLANQPALDQLGFATREELNRGIGALADEIQTRDAETGAFIPVEHQAFTRALAGERIVQDVMVRHRGTGEDRVVRCAAAPVAVDGRVIAAVAVNTDVTAARRAAAERERLLAALGAERERLRSLILHMPAPLALLEGPEHRFALVNDAYRQVSGPRPDSVGRTLREVFPELAGQGLYERFDAVYATGAPWASPETLARYDRDGTGVQDTWWHVRLEPVREAGADGAPSRVVAILNYNVDVTAQVRARREVERLLAGSEAARAEAERAAASLAESEERFRLMADAVPQIVWLTDAEGRTEFFNRQWTAYTGAPYEPSTAAQIAADFVHPDDRAPTIAAFAEARRAGGVFAVEHRIRSASGAYRWFLVRAEPYRDPATGAVVRWFGASVDIDDRKRDEADRERLLAAAEAARAEAEGARRAAETANHAKSAFLANMSHELRTPLNAIGGYVQLLEMGLHGPVTEAQRTALSRVQRAQHRLLGLVNDVLNYAKLEGGRVEYDVRAVDVRAVIADVVPLVEPQLAAKALAFDVALPDGPCVVWADREKLGQVLLNLLANAAKFTPARDPASGAPGRVTVHLGTRAAAGDAVFVRVTDTGRGVPRAKQDVIFDPFVQVRTGDSSYAHGTEGTGLGLAISRDLARGMGGDLRVRSVEGEGATFTVTLRRVVGDAPRDDAPDPPPG